VDLRAARHPNDQQAASGLGALEHLYGQVRGGQLVDPAKYQIGDQVGALDSIGAAGAVSDPDHDDAAVGVGEAGGGLGEPADGVVAGAALALEVQRR